MKIIEPYAILLNPYEEETDVWVRAMRKIEFMARISHRTEATQTSDSWRRFITDVVINHGDWSVTEHSSATVLFRVDRGITHELVRHRLFSFTQESTRFVRYGGKMVQEMEFIRPLEIPQAGVISDPRWFDWADSVDESEKTYFNLLEHGARPQEARSVLPNALAATIAMTGNFRNWRWFFLSRTSREAHPDMRRVTVPLLKTFKERIPILFDDIDPEQRQIDNFQKPR